MRLCCGLLCPEIVGESDNLFGSKVCCNAPFWVVLFSTCCANFCVFSFIFTLFAFAVFTIVDFQLVVAKFKKHKIKIRRRSRHHNSTLHSQLSKLINALNSQNSISCSKSRIGKKFLNVLKIFIGYVKIITIQANQFLFSCKEIYFYF